MKASVLFLKKDPHFAPLVKKHGSPDFSRYFTREHTIFLALLRAIIYQQLSGKAAGAIHSRILALFPDKKPTPELLLKIRAPRLRKAGLSVQKITYVRDLAKKFQDGIVDEKKFGKMTSQEIIDHLRSVRGIGTWTAQMLLLFTLKRLDILPTGDLGIRKGFQIVYQLKKQPTPQEMERLAKPWRAHASAASWYLWRAADAAKAPQKEVH